MKSHPRFEVPRPPPADTTRPSAPYQPLAGNDHRSSAVYPSLRDHPTSSSAPYPPVNHHPGASASSIPPPYPSLEKYRAGSHSSAAAASYPSLPQTRSSANTTDELRSKSLMKFIHKYESMFHCSSTNYSCRARSFFIIVNKIFADRLRALKGCEIVFVCDDSGSMNLELSCLLYTSPSPRD